MTKRITILDDHEELVEVLGELLVDAGYAVTPLGGDHTTLDELVATRPDLIILDLVFPGDGGQMNGWEYLRLIRAHEALQAIPVLICSADVIALRSRRAELGRDPAVSSLEKPFTIEAAEQAVSKLLDARRAPAWDEETEFVLVADATSKLVDASALALRVLGWTIDELRQLDVGDIVANPPEWTATEWQRYTDDGHWEGAFALRLRDGSEVPASAIADILSDTHTRWHISRITTDGRDRPAAI